MKGTQWNGRFLEGINERDSEAWRELYASFYGTLCSYALGVLKNHDRAEDVVQDTLMQVWYSALQFRDAGALAVYLYRAVYHNSLKALRDRQIDDSHIARYLAEKEEQSDEYLYRAVEEEMVRRLRAAIDRLPGQQKNILQLSIEGASVQDVARRLSVSINTVKTQKKRAYAFLKDLMKDSCVLFIVFGLLK